MTRAGRPGQPRFFAPEVVQTSAMDCGPAALKILLEGFGVPVHYGRLREACHTSVDGTSIDTLEEVAGLLGLELEQILLPAEHLLDPAAGALPALAVVLLPSKMLHFVVVWRRVGPLIQVSDPVKGRRWLRPATLLRDLYIHEMEVPAEAMAEAVTGPQFQDPLRHRLRALVGERRAAELLPAGAPPDCRSWAGLDAVTRTVEAAASRVELGAGQRPALWEKLWHETRAAGLAPGALVGERWWTVRAGTAAGGATVTVRGTVVLHAHGVKTEARPAGLPVELAAALATEGDQPGRQVWRLLRADGWRTLVATAGLLLVVGAATLLEALLLRSLVDLGTYLGKVGQRAFAFGALVVFIVAIGLLEWTAIRALWGSGRRLEVRLRRAFLRKIPRLPDRYFRSRPTSDMIERAHLSHRLALVPALGGNLFFALAQLVATAVGLAWLYPPGAWLTALAAVAMVVVPLLIQPALAEGDLRLRTHAGALARYYLDALQGLTALRAHGATRPILRDHDDRLGEWAVAARAALGISVTSETATLLLGAGLSAWLLVDYLGSGSSGWALLIIYWSMSLPELGREIAFFLQQAPGYRNVTLRLFEPLGAPEVDGGDGVEDDRGAPPAALAARAPGVALRFEGIRADVGGRPLLAVDHLEIAPGEHLAVVGPSGAGKSSFFGLLLGWVDATEGRVRVDGQPLDAGVLARLRRDTAWAEPGVQLWNRSLLENLRFGSAPDADPAGVIEEAELYEVLYRLPRGLATGLGESGGFLSGGEGQRVRFGRALNRRQARLVLLDEAFRGLERDRRARLLERARRHFAGATLLYATHDLAEASTFPRVLVIDGGRIVEDGAPQDLLGQSDSRLRALTTAARALDHQLRTAITRSLLVSGGRTRPMGSGVGDGASEGVGDVAGEAGP